MWHLKGVLELFKDVTDPQKIIDRHLERYGSIITKKDEQIASLMSMLELKDRLIVQLTQKL